MSTAVKLLRFVGHCFAANLSAKMEYRASFFSQIFGMIVNDVLWLVFWWLFFTRFPVVNGWQRDDILMLWALVAFGFGVKNAVFGNFRNIATIIAQGQLDQYLATPKNVLLHVLVSDLEVIGLGDLVFGPLLFALFLPLSWQRVALFLVAGVLVGLLLTAWAVLVHSLAFFFGNAESFAAQAYMSMLHFTTYPIDIFDGWAKLMLFTVLPAGFVSSVPVRIMRHFEPLYLLGLVGATAALSAIATYVFYRGLVRYESGNLVTTRS